MEAISKIIDRIQQNDEEIIRQDTSIRQSIRQYSSLLNNFHLDQSLPTSKQLSLMLAEFSKRLLRSQIDGPVLDNLHNQLYTFGVKLKDKQMIIDNYEKIIQRYDGALKSAMKKIEVLDTNYREAISKVEELNKVLSQLQQVDRKGIVDQVVQYLPASCNRQHMDAQLLRDVLKKTQDLRLQTYEIMKIFELECQTNKKSLEDTILHSNNQMQLLMSQRFEKSSYSQQQSTAQLIQQRQLLISKLTNQIDMLKSQIDTLKDRVNILNEQNSPLSKQVTTLNTNITCLENQNSRLNRQVASLNEQLTIQQVQMDIMTQDATKTDKIQQQYKNKIDQLQKTIRILQDKSLQAEVIKPSQQITKKPEAHIVPQGSQSLHLQIDLLKKQIHSMQQRLQDSVKAYQTQLSVSTAQKIQLQQKEATISIILQEVTDLKSTIEQLRNEIAWRQQQLKSSVKQCSQLKTLLNTTKKQLEQVKQQHKKQKDKLLASQKQKQILQYEQIKTLREEQEDIRKRMQQDHQNAIQTINSQFDRRQKSYFERVRRLQKLILELVGKRLETSRQPAEPLQQKLQNYLLREDFSMQGLRELIGPYFTYNPYYQREIENRNRHPIQRGRQAILQSSQPSVDIDKL